MANAVYAQIARGFIKARGEYGTQEGAGVDLAWQVEGAPAEPAQFRAIWNPLSPVANGVDRNQGDDTPGVLTVLVADLPSLPQQGDAFTDAAGRIYRVGPIEYVPGHPLIHLTIPNAVTL